MNPKFQTCSQIIPLEKDEYSYILFRNFEFPGMVGETITSRHATMFIEWYNSRKKKTEWIVKDLDYNDLKSIYKSIKGRKNRIEYYRWMYCFSPEYITQETEREVSDAISRVI